MAFKPLIGVTACVKQIGLHPYHISGDKYLRAVSVAALGLPVVIPSLGDLTEIEDLLPQLDGLLLTGSPSNVEPFHYQGPASAPGTEHDPQRDQTTLPDSRGDCRRRSGARHLPRLSGDERGVRWQPASEGP